MFANNHRKIWPTVSGFLSTQDVDLCSGAVQVPFHVPLHFFEERNIFGWVIAAIITYYHHNYFTITIYHHISTIITWGNKHPELFVMGPGVP